MSITDELREWGKRLYTPNSASLKNELERIADRIDAEHERATAGCIHYDPDRHYCSVHGDTDNGWVRLPKDADGVPIRVGDEMVCINNGEHCPVEYIVLTEDGWEVDGESPASMRHYHTPTVESILREFVEEWDCLFDYERDVLIAEYAAKLRIAGEDE